MTEYEIHKAVVEHLRHRALTKVWFHVPNGGSRHPAEAANLKRMGTRAGVADLLFLRHGEAFALELKAAKGKVTEHQFNFACDWNDEGGQSYCARSLDEAIAWLELNGLVTCPSR